MDDYVNHKVHRTLIFHEIIQQFERILYRDRSHT